MPPHLSPRLLKYTVFNSPRGHSLFSRRVCFLKLRPDPLCFCCKHPSVAALHLFFPIHDQFEEVVVFLPADRDCRLRLPSFVVEKYSIICLSGDPGLEVRCKRSRNFLKIPVFCVYILYYFLFLCYIVFSEEWTFFRGNDN